MSTSSANLIFIVWPLYFSPILMKGYHMIFDGEYFNEGILYNF